MEEKNAANKSIKKAGIIGALLGALSLAGFTLWGISTVYATSSFLLWAFPAFLALIFGAAIGGGLGVWISELHKKSQQYRSK